MIVTKSRLITALSIFCVQVISALETLPGYTASMYENEKDIGWALEKLLPKYNLKRKDIFITTKLHPNHLGDRTMWAIKRSIKRLNCDYIDLFLIHWPGNNGTCSTDPGNTILRNISWKNMVKAVKAKLVKQIGVCNYTVRHLEELLRNCYGMKPVVNQVEWHPFCRDRKLMDLCRKQRIFLQAHSSLGNGEWWSKLLVDETINKISFKIGKTPAQVLLRWALQQNVGVIPRSQMKSQLFSNFQLNFNIPDDDLVTLSILKKRVRFERDPNLIL